MRVKRSLTWLSILTVVAILTVGIALDTRAEEKKELVFGIIGHMTGAYASAQAGIVEGHMDAIKTLNEMNYIPGATLKGIWVDGGTDAAKSMTGLKKMLAHEPKPVEITGMSTPIALALKKWYVKAQVPTVDTGSDVKLGKQPSWTFSIPCPNVNLAGAWVDYYLANIWKDKSRKPRFAFLTWDNGWGRSPITPEVKKYIESKGVDIVAEEFIPTVPTDVTAQMLRLKEKKVDFTYGGFYATALAIVLKDADKLGMIDDITIGCAYAHTPETLIKSVGDLTRNTWVVSPQYPETILLSENRTPVIFKAYKDNGRTKFQYVTYAMGFAVASAAVEAARMAAEEVGVNNVDGRAVYNALKRLENFNSFGYYVPFSFNSGRWYGQDKCILMTFKDKKIAYKGVIPAPDLTTKYE